ncbi:hypothetical protein AJ80_02402 [Polytolypa hystricis UAMH7299]|uniref:Non-reducing polyketide synthase nscA n=1 Tax=Polytolypa hystricis (strain UAMH7299) TaxID=1447883 RepID=A0A2B7YRD6_POLH7|nr:hypothetical protein AJ80_02402 [Polytolypa hystricis UAMH7299]
MTANHSPSAQSGEPIAIVGSGCRFPGGANSPSKLWELLRSPRDVLKKIPTERFNPDGFYHPDGEYHGHMNVQHTYMLDEDHRQFDAGFFNISVSEASSIDPQQRFLLETVYEALESAGLAIERLRGSNTAVYIGAMCGEYSDLLIRDLNSMPSYFATGTARSILANRISYFYDWHGPSMTIDTACSSSLVALNHAVQTLRAGTSRVAVAAGANILLGPEAYIAESKFHMLSPNGRSHMWDSRADGYGRGDGVAAVVLKTLKAAIEDGDHIECIIRETGVNQDGRTKGITMPSADAQVALIEDTYRRAGLDINTASGRCQYFEAHGTGTPAGDPIEAEAIHRSLGSRIDGDDTLFVGTIKTVIGHTEGTAGIAGLLKASMALQNSLILPNMLFEQLNPRVAPFYSHLQIPTSAMPWPSLPSGVPRRASVNSFGFGGTNAHAILEGYDAPEDHNSVSSVFVPFVFSALTESSLKRVLTDFVDYLEESPTADLRDLSWTLHSRRSVFPIRAAFPGLTVDGLRAAIIDGIEASGANGKPLGSRVSSGNSQLLGIFTGQGAQWPAMGRELVIRSSYVQSRIDYLESVLASLPQQDQPSWSLKAELLADAKSRLHEATLSQPLCTAVQVVLVDLLSAANIKFSAVVGHSSGEIGAAYAAGFISARDAIIIAYYRGLHAHLAQGKVGEKGAMMAVGISPQEGQEFCDRPEFKDRMSVAACNSPLTITLSGDFDVVEKARGIFEAEGKFARLLRVDKAYHSHHMLPCSQQYIDSLTNANITAKQTPGDCRWYSSVYCRQMTDTDSNIGASYWAQNMTECVMFSQAVEAALSDPSNQFTGILEVGPHGALKGPTEDTIKEHGVDALPYSSCLVRNKNDIESFSAALAHVWKYSPGSFVDLEGFEKLVSGPATKRPTVVKTLPKYSWDHDGIHWHESRRSRALRRRNEAGHPLLGNRNPDGTDHDITWQNILRVSELPWLRGHQLQGQIVFPAAGYVVLAMEAALQVAGRRTVSLIEARNISIVRPITFEDERHGVETLFNLHIESGNVKSGDTILASFRVNCAPTKDSENVVLVASGQIEISFEAETAADMLLPPRAEIPPYMSEVDVDELYNSLTDVGYLYSGSFRALSSMKRKLGRVAGSVANPAIDLHWSEENLLIHPGMLDATVQSLLLAHSSPGDGRLWSLHVPTSISSIRVDVSSCRLHRDSEFTFDTVLTQRESGGKNAQSEIHGDIEVFSGDGSHGMIQVEGLSLVPFAPASASQDCQLFFHNIWNPAEADGELAVGQSTVPDEEIEFGWVLERVSYFYLRKLVQEITQEDLDKAEWHHHKLLDYAHHVINCVNDGTQAYGKKEWNDDTAADLDAIMEQYADTIELKLMRGVGENLVAAVRGETVILQHMLKDGMLNRYYAEALGLEPYTAFFAEVAAQIAHRYPRMNILEIGAGTGAATKGITKRLGEAFSSYTYTDISTGFFETASEVFANFSDRMIYKALDAEKDVVSQGFKEHAYDMIVASNVLHATKDLNHTMTNVRKLLKPGGLLLLFEVTSNDTMRTSFTMGGISGWWIGADTGRPWSPCISAVEWNTLLLETGFSGIDTITPEMHTLARPFSVIVSRAVDDNINLLLEPTLSPSPDSRIRDLVIVGGTTLKTSRLASKIGRILNQHTSSLTTIASLDDVAKIRSVSPMSTVLCLSELDRPVFEYLTSDSFASLKSLFSKAQNILWITQGCRSDNPYANAMVGFGRAAAMEMSHVRLQLVDLDNLSKPDPQMLADLLLRLQITDSLEKRGHNDDILWSNEPEIAVENGSVLVPRIVPRNEPNDRYNAERRKITSRVSPLTARVTVEKSRDGSVLSQDHSALALFEDTLSDAVRVDVTYSLRFAIPISSTTAVYLVLGHAAKSNDTVVALSAINGSSIVVPKAFAKPYAGALGNSSPHDLLLIAYNLLSQFILSTVESDTHVLLFEPDALLLDVVRRRLSERGICVSAITTSTSATSKSERIFIHPLASSRAIKASIPARVSMFLDFSLATGKPDISRNRIMNCLPTTTRILDFSTLQDSQSSTVLNSCATMSDMLGQAIDSASHVDIPSDSTGTIIHPNELLHNTASLSSVVDWTMTESVPVTVKPADHAPMLRSNGTYVLIGLAGGLGITLCGWLVDQGARHIVITSRNPKVDPMWISALEAKGAKIYIYSSDVTNKQSLQDLFSHIRANLPPIAGVANGAMVLADTPLLEMSFDQMQRVLKPKVDGSRYIDELLYDDPLDFFVLFSSLSCVFGNSGQSNYAAANMYMVSLAAQRRRRGLAASAIDIGAILGVGYIAREATQTVLDQLSNAGYRFLSERDFHLAFAEAIICGRPDSGQSEELITGLRITNADEEFKPAWCSNPRFCHTVRTSMDDQSADRGKEGAALPVRALLQAATCLEQVTQTVQGAVINKLKIVLQLRSDTTNDPTALLEQTADDLGIDSLVAVELRSWFLRELQVDMPVLKILGGATVGEIVDHAAKNLPTELIPLLGGDDDSTASESDSLVIIDTPYTGGSSPQSSPMSRSDSLGKSSSTLSSQTDLVSWSDITEPVPDTPPKMEATNKIDWNNETTVEHAISQLKAPSFILGAKDEITVAITGATGFLGGALLQQLANMGHVTKIHCLAVRNVNKFAGKLHAKVTVHEGDLTQTRLGLSAKDAELVFRETDVIIHNGADVTFLRTYRRLKDANVTSTKELVRLALSYGNVKQFHFVSTASVGQVTMREELYEESVARYIPYDNGANGYATTKWTGEVYLENVSKATNLGVWIHRPSTITGDGAPQTDVMLNILRYSKQIKAVPSLRNLTGWFHFVGVEEVVKGITEQFYTPLPASSSVAYLNHCGDVKVNVRGLKEYLQNQDGETYQVLGQKEWNKKAQKFGMQESIAVFLEISDEAKKLLQLMRRGRKE